MKESRFRLIVANFVIIVTLGLTLGIAFAASAPADIGAINASSAIYSGKADGDGVALMFNVYQNTEETLAIADIFERYGFRCTFFVGGSWASRNGDALIRLAAGGFEIGNHGYLHRDHAKLSVEQNADEIMMTEKTLNAYLKDLDETHAYAPSKLFAPPSGSIGNNMFEACKKLDMKVIMWTRDTIDWRDQNADLIYERAVKNMKAGDLILMHPTPKSVEALPQILDKVKESGLKADTVGNVI